MPDSAQHAAALSDWLADCPGALVAYSAGVDSSLVAYAAFKQLGAKKMLAVMTASPSLKRGDLEEGKQFCAKHGIPLRIIQTQELENPNYAANPNNRCYFCKTTLYGDMSGLLKEFPSYWLMNGQNTDDAGDYRPGIQAAEEHAVKRPLADCALDKQAVRDLAEHYKLDCWDKPASPCLSSRIPYGQDVTLDKLKRIEAAETLLNKLGFDICRVRHDGTTARIEVPNQDLDRLKSSRSAFETTLLNDGFTAIEIDEEGFVSGKLNRAIIGLTIKQTKQQTNR